MLARAMFAAEEVVGGCNGTSGRLPDCPSLTADDVTYGTKRRRNCPSTRKRSCGLSIDPSAYWVTDDTPSELNSLVEYPVGTVVLVVKPPGSHHEFELKRVGRRGDHPLSVRSHVPASHRLDGGSMLSSLQWDAARRPPWAISTASSTASPHRSPGSCRSWGSLGVPGRDRRASASTRSPNTSLIRTVYGAGYDAMRKAMAIVVDCFRQERGDIVPPIPGDYGLTAQFLALAGPAQAIICGSSSFRLDLVAKYLSADGPDAYFRHGLEIEYEPRMRSGWPTTSSTRPWESIIRRM